MMKPWITALVVLLMSHLSWAAKEDLETGERCKGAGCAGIEVEVERPATDAGASATLPDVDSACETVARRLYDLCLASPGATGPSCQSEYETALSNCKDIATGKDDDEPVVEAKTPDCNAPPYTETADTLGIDYPAGSNLSNGIYRIPYENGTEVNISGDFYNHLNTQGKVDMMGRGGQPYRVVAAADGCIVYLQDKYSKVQVPGMHSEPCANNYVWIKHANGEWTKYTHMKKDSIRIKAGLRKGDFVTKGTYLGDQGSVGCSFPAHLHFEVVVPDSPDPGVETKGGGINGWTLRQARNPFICGIADGTFQNKKNYIAVTGPGVIPPNTDEDMRAGMPYHNYRCLLRRAVLGGFQPGWIDVFSNDKDPEVNILVRPKTSAWATRSDMGGDALEQAIDEFSKKGYRLQQLESYRDGKLLYAGVWSNSSGPKQKYYAGQSQKRHAELLDEYGRLGYRPVSISVVPKSGLKYTSVWEKAPGGYTLRSAMTIQEYRDLAAEKRKQGQEVVYLNAFVDNKTPYISAIWHSGTGGEVRRRTNLTQKDFEFQRDLARKEGFHTKAFTAYELDGKVRYIAVFAK